MIAEHPLRIAVAGRALMFCAPPATHIGYSCAWWWHSVRLCALARLRNRGQVSLGMTTWCRGSCSTAIAYGFPFIQVSRMPYKADPSPAASPPARD